MRKPKAGDVWEYFRDDVNAPGHSWSMTPTHWMPLPEAPTPEEHYKWSHARRVAEQEGQ